ncbi:MAG: DUF447 domain-containing protein [Candidatus Bathyarchaeia archaeon]
MAAKLTDLGFLKGVIAECIVSTYNMDGKPNAAPMGVIMEDEQHLIVNLFNSSTTCSNIKANRCAIVNLTSNIEVFYKTAFKEANIDGKVPQEWFEQAKAVNAPKLRFADATIDVSVTDMTQIDTEKTRVVCNVELVQATRKLPQVHCRAMDATLEAIIHATRVKAFLNGEGEQKKVSKLLELIEGCNEVVNRVAPNSSYSIVMADLMKRIDSWRNKTEGLR